MTELQANFTLEPQQPINASFELGDPTPIEATLSLNVTNTEHDKLTNRDLPDQHPIGAITGLQDALDDCVDDAELEAALLEKQDVIRDLSEIRQGATLGATAVQPSDLESYATKDYVDNGLSGKQDTLTAGANIQIVGNTISATNTWGNITGILSAQTDLWNVLEEKANVADIPTATSDLLNDSGFITLSALTPYATQTWVTQQGYLTEIPAEYVTDSELTAKGYQTAADVETAITAKGYTTMSAVEAKGYITNAALAPYVLSSSLATVATSGSYSDLINKPTIPAAQVNADWNATSGVARILNKPSIPTDTSDLTNGAGFITGITSSDVTTALGYTPYNSSNPSGFITSAALNGYATESYVTTATANMQTTGNLVTSISSSSTDTQYPSAKCVYYIVGDIESAINTIRVV